MQKVLGNYLSTVEEIVAEILNVDQMSAGVLE